MKIRDATPADTAAIRQIARRSLLESYGELLSRETIEDAVAQWFDEDRLVDLLDDPETAFFPLVEIDDEIVAFAQCHLVENPERIGELHWLHVDPASRGKGIGRSLYEHVEKRFDDLGITRLKGLVFEKNEAGNEFFRAHGYELAYTHRQTVAGREHVENVYVKITSDEEWRQELEPFETADGDLLYIAYYEASIGSAGPFHMTYRDPDREHRFGWYCSVCEKIDTAMDPMGRVICNECGNRRKATRWDAAYL